MSASTGPRRGVRRHSLGNSKTTQAIGNGSYALPAERNPETVLPIARPMLTIEIGSPGFTPIPKFPN